MKTESAMGIPILNRHNALIYVLEFLSSKMWLTTSFGINMLMHPY